MILPYFASRLDVGSDILGCRGWGKALDDASLLVNQELGEVPLDGVAEQAAFFALQKLVYRMRVCAVDFDLREQREVDAVIGFAERLDFVVVAGLLMAELVAGEAKNLEAAVVYLA